MYSSGWLNQNENLSSAIYTIPKVFVTRNSSPDQLVCWGMSSITSVFWDIRLRMWKTSLLPSPVNCFRTSFAISTPLKAWGRPGNSPSLPLQLRESTLLCGHLHASAMHTVHRMVSNNPPPPLQTHISRILKRLAPYSDLNPSTNIFVVFCLQGLKQADGTSDLRHLQGRPISSEIWQEYLTRLSAILVQAMLGCFNSSPEIQPGHERQFLSSSYTCQVAEQESGEATILRFMHVHLAILLQIFFDDLLISICYSWVLY